MSESKQRFLTRIGDGLIVGIMIALVLALTGTIWQGFNKATDELKTTRQQLQLQNNANSKFSEFNELQIQKNEKLATHVEELKNELKNLRSANIEMAKRVEELETQLTAAAVEPGKKVQISDFDWNKYYQQQKPATKPEMPVLGFEQQAMIQQDLRILNKEQRSLER